MSHTLRLPVWQASHTGVTVMKMTMHIDEDVLDRVMKVTGAATKREAVEIALNEMARRHKLKELFSQGLGLTPEQLKAEFAPTAADQFDRPLQSVAEAKSPHGEPGPAR